MLLKVRTEYQSLMVRSKWPKFGKAIKTSEETDTVSRKRNPETDLASLLAKSEVKYTYQIKALTNMLKKSQPSHSTKTTVGKSPHAWENQFGKSKEFPDREFFHY